MYFEAVKHLKALFWRNFRARLLLFSFITERRENTTNITNSPLNL